MRKRPWSSFQAADDDGGDPGAVYGRHLAAAAVTAGQAPRHAAAHTTAPYDVGSYEHTAESLYSYSTSAPVQYCEGGREEWRHGGEGSPLLAAEHHRPKVEQRATAGHTGHLDEAQAWQHHEPSHSYLYPPPPPRNIAIGGHSPRVFPISSNASTPHSHTNSQPTRPPSISHSPASWSHSHHPYIRDPAPLYWSESPADTAAAYPLAPPPLSAEAGSVPAAHDVYTDSPYHSEPYQDASEAYTYYEQPAPQPNPSRAPETTWLPPPRATLHRSVSVDFSHAAHHPHYGVRAQSTNLEARSTASPAFPPMPPFPHRPVSQPAPAAAGAPHPAATGLPDRTLETLRQAYHERASHRTAAPILAFNPAREKSASAKQLVETAYGVTYAVVASGQGKGKARAAELLAACSSCQMPRVKCIMRGTDLGGWTPRVNFQCLDCMPPEAFVSEPGASEARDERLAARAFEEFQQAPSGISPAQQQQPSMSPPVQHEHDRVTFRDTFSGAVDEIGRSHALPGSAQDLSGSDHLSTANPRSRLLLPPEETAKGLSAAFKRQAMCCDVCNRIIGAGAVESLTPGVVPSFTVEAICCTCLERYRACSDCGGGGGRLTPGRWRCKGADSKSTNRSDVLRITEIDPSKLASLDERLRKIYYNVRMRMQARPEMLERGDGLATTFAQVEKLIVDGWTLLRPLLSDDVEATRGLRRYVALQTSTPHRRRAKPKPGSAPKLEPAPARVDPVEKEVSGFLLLEHELATGAVHVAVTMPWAISGDAFDATTILLDETLKRIRHDLAYENMLRAERSAGFVPPLPDPTYLWGITPFKGDSRMTQSLTRRGFHFIEDRLQEDPDFDLSIFPPHRTVHVPNEFMRSFRIFLRDVTEDDGRISGVPGSEQSAQRNSSEPGRPPPKKRARHLKAR
ncbi:hypothetical protein JCM8202v2_006199 [Rhodotorula sphaerocarpa]